MDIGDFCNDYCLGDCHNCNPCYGCEDYVNNKCISNGGCGVAGLEQDLMLNKGGNLNERNN